MRLGIIGGGRAAWAFGSGWQGAHRPLAGIALRPGSRSDLPERLRASRRDAADLAREADALLVAVSDPALAEVAAEVAALALPEVALFHASGGLASSVFGREHSFSLHPLRSLPPVGTSVDLAGTLFVWEGPPATKALASEIVATLGGTMREVRADAKVLYHAAAVLASNDVAALLEIARGIMSRCGLGDEELRPALAELARSAVANWESSPTAFTGPVARGDAAMVERHLTALGEAHPEEAEIYRRLALEVARAIGAEGRATAELTGIIDLLRSRTLS